MKKCLLLLLWGLSATQLTFGMRAAQAASRQRRAVSPDVQVGHPVEDRPQTPQSPRLTLPPIQRPRTPSPDELPSPSAPVTEERNYGTRASTFEYPSWGRTIAISPNVNTTIRALALRGDKYIDAIAASESSIEIHSQGQGGPKIFRFPAINEMRALLDSRSEPEAREHLQALHQQLEFARLQHFTYLPSGRGTADEQEYVAAEQASAAKISAITLPGRITSISLSGKTLSRKVLASRGKKYINAIRLAEQKTAAAKRFFGGATAPAVPHSGNAVRTLQQLVSAQSDTEAVAHLVTLHKQLTFANADAAHNNTIAETFKRIFPDESPVTQGEVPESAAS